MIDKELGEPAALLAVVPTRGDGQKMTSKTENGGGMRAEGKAASELLAAKRTRKRLAREEQSEQRGERPEGLWPPIAAGKQQKQLTIVDSAQAQMKLQLARQMSGGQCTRGWRVEWSGSFPVAKVSAESVVQRLDSLLAVGSNSASGLRRLAAQWVLLSISPEGVSASAVDDDHRERSLLWHPVRKVCSLLGRAQSRQLAYVTREQISHAGQHFPYRRLCHVFRAQSADQLRQIEAALYSVFQCTMAPPAPPQSSPPSPWPPSVRLRDAGTSPLESTPMLRTPKKAKGLLQRGRSRIRISSSTLLQKIFGSGITPNKSAINVDNFRKPRWPISPLRARSPIRQRSRVECCQYSLAAALETPLSRVRTAADLRIRPQQAQSTGPGSHWDATDHFVAHPAEEEQQQMVYEPRLREWVLPLDQLVLDQLHRLAYFVRPTEKELVLQQLSRMSVGHFALRLSGSRHRCLALTVRVERTEANPEGLANYLVLRNRQGFRIRGSDRHFQSLPMLVTQHTVLADQLPCLLQLSDWRWTREPQVTVRRRQSSGGSTLAALRAREQSRPRSPDSTMVRWRIPGQQTATEDGGGLGKTNARTNSTLFSSKSSAILLSA